MAKLYGLNGVGTGKLGNQVLVIRNGEQIVRQYNPSPENPKSLAQVEARAKLKLASQLSAVMAPIMLMRKEGLVSARNIFTRINYPAIGYADNKATINLLGVKVTQGVIGLPNLVLTRSDSTLQVNLAGPNPTTYDKVVYALLIKQGDGAMRLGDSVVVTDGGANNSFPATLQMTSATARVVVYAYGIRFNSNTARAKYGDISCSTADQLAKLLVTYGLLDSDVTVTETKAGESDPA